LTRKRSALLDYLTALGDNASPFLVGQVAAVGLGAAADGNDLVTVDWMGTEVEVSYGAHYSPVVGHVVLMARTQPLAILCRLIGTPPSS
jgi:hypothetical protein